MFPQATITFGNSLFRIVAFSFSTWSIAVSVFKSHSLEHIYSMVISSALTAFQGYIWLLSTSALRAFTQPKKALQSMWPLSLLRTVFIITSTLQCLNFHSFLPSTPTPSSSSSNTTRKYQLTWTSRRRLPRRLPTTLPLPLHLMQSKPIDPHDADEKNQGEDASHNNPNHSTSRCTRIRSISESKSWWWSIWTIVCSHHRRSWCRHNYRSSMPIIAELYCCYVCGLGMRCCKGDVARKFSM